METNEIAEEIVLLLIKNIPDKTGKEFTNQANEILTLCISEMIKAAYCPDHYQEVIDKVMELIIEDCEAI